MIYRIAVPSNLRRLFDYLPPEYPVAGTLEPGCRVKVPFGSRELTGLVIECLDSSEISTGKLRPISAVLDDRPLLDPLLLKLGLWASQYYQHPVGDTLSALLPALLRKGEALRKHQQECWQLTTLGKGLPETALSRAKKQQQLLNLLQDNQICPTEQIEAAGISRAIIRTLSEKQLVKKVLVELAPTSPAVSQLLAEAPLPLREEQQLALDAIDTPGFHPVLLQGATGSGKTEVYLQAIERVLNRGKQALVLIPEINLTPQTLSRFRQRFNCPLAVLHSGLTDVERLDAWQQAQAGTARIVIGTRSAVFTPLPELGIIIVDEEHDSSYKQQDGFRYSARDVAVVRASLAQVPIVLGTATPALESLYNADRGRYRHIHLHQRPQSVTPPQWQLVDIRQQQLRSGLAEPVISAISETLARNEQVLVFLNRRGYAPLLMCHDCGWSAQCEHCETRMTTHLQQRRLLCHHCEKSLLLPNRCPRCASPNLQFIGQGTERGEELLQTLLPDARVVRIDSDTTRTKHAMANLVEDIGRGEPCILLGTQMLAKGHHFPNVTLAVLLDVDSGLFSADFRATERMGQLITQVAGRAGRGDKPGKVMIQSHHCEHPFIQQLASEGYEPFARTLMVERQLAEAPPFASLAVVRAEARDAHMAEILLKTLRSNSEQTHPPSPSLRYLGPLPSAMEKRKDRYRYQLEIYAHNRRQLQQLLTEQALWLEADKSARKVRWAIDVDPQDML